MIKKNHSLYGKITRPSSWAQIQGPCGDRMEFFLKISGGVIRRVRCFTSGCGASKVCALETARMARGKGLARALCISPGEVIQRLKNVPIEHLHCAILSVSTLHRAIAHFLMSGKKKISLRTQKVFHDR